MTLRDDIKRNWLAAVFACGIYGMTAFALYGRRWLDVVCWLVVYELLLRVARRRSVRWPNKRSNNGK